MDDVELAPSPCHRECAHSCTAPMDTAPWAKTRVPKALREERVAELRSNGLTKKEAEELGRQTLQQEIYNQRQIDKNQHHECSASQAADAIEPPPRKRGRASAAADTANSATDSELLKGSQEAGQARLEGKLAHANRVEEMGNPGNRPRPSASSAGSSSVPVVMQLLRDNQVRVGACSSRCSGQFNMLG